MWKRLKKHVKSLNCINNNFNSVIKRLQIYESKNNIIIHHLQNEKSL